MHSTTEKTNAVVTTGKFGKPTKSPFLPPIQMFVPNHQLMSLINKKSHNCWIRVFVPKMRDETIRDTFSSKFLANESRLITAFAVQSKFREKVSFCFIRLPHCLWMSLSVKTAPDCICKKNGLFWANGICMKQKSHLKDEKNERRWWRRRRRTKRRRWWANALQKCIRLDK